MNPQPPAPESQKNKPKSRIGKWHKLTDWLATTATAIILHLGRGRDKERKKKKKLVEPGLVGRDYACVTRVMQPKTVVAHFHQGKKVCQTLGAVAGESTVPSGRNSTEQS